MIDCFGAVSVFAFSHIPFRNHYIGKVFKFIGGYVVLHTERFDGNLLCLQIAGNESFCRATGINLITQHRLEGGYHLLIESNNIFIAAYLALRSLSFDCWSRSTVRTLFIIRLVSFNNFRIFSWKRS